MNRTTRSGPEGERAMHLQPFGRPSGRGLPWATVALMAALAAAMLMPGAARALELGKLQWRPATADAPAHAEILLRDRMDIDPTGIRARLGVKESYAVAGLTYLPAFAQVLVKPVKRDDGKVVLRLDGLPADVPQLDLLVTVNYKLRMSLAEFRVEPRRGAAEFAALVPGARLAASPAPSAVAMAAAAPPAAGPLAAAVATPVMAVAPATEQPSSPAAVGDPPAPAAAAVAALQAWAEAWSRRDVEAYLAAYAPDHVGRGAPDAAAWRELRRARIQARERIDVRLSGLRTRLEGSRVVATFVQSYRADGLHETVRKRVVLAPTGPRWLIVEEAELR